MGYEHRAYRYSAKFQDPEYPEDDKLLLLHYQAHPIRQYAYSEHHNHLDLWHYRCPRQRAEMTPRASGQSHSLKPMRSYVYKDKSSSHPEFRPKVRS